jgi:hypothetical protein
VEELEGVAVAVQVELFIFLLNPLARLRTLVLLVEEALLEQVTTVKLLLTETTLDLQLQPRRLAAEEEQATVSVELMVDVVEEQAGVAGLLIAAALVHKVETDRAATAVVLQAEAVEREETLLLEAAEQELQLIHLGA